MAQWDAEHSPWFKLLRQRRPLTPEARILGYEVVGAEEYLDLHAWHCHGYADEVHTALGVRTNSKSLIPNFAAAQSRPEMDAHSALQGGAKASSVDRRGLGTRGVKLCTVTAACASVTAGASRTDIARTSLRKPETRSLGDMQ